jgi:hypothetical protein
MKEVILFTLVFTLINIYIYYYVENLNTCIDSNSKMYILLFYGICLIYLVYLFTKKNEKFTPSDSKSNTITIDLTKNPEYNSKTSKVIYWGSDFNVNGIVDIVDIVDGKVTIQCNNTSLKYRLIDINEKLSEIYSV